MRKVSVVRYRTNPESREQWLADYQEKNYEFKNWGPMDPEPWELLWDMVMEELRWWTDHLSRAHRIVPADREQVSELGRKLDDIRSRKLDTVAVHSLGLEFAVRY